MQNDIFDMIASPERLRQQQRALHQSPSPAEPQKPAEKPKQKQSEPLSPVVEGVGTIPNDIMDDVDVPLLGYILRGSRLRCPQPKCHENLIRAISSSKAGR